MSTSNEQLALTASAALVPASYAEKAMASLMQLHSELMDEKERRVDLFRRLMEREQALAELKMYVKLLEEKAAAPPLAPTPAPAAPEVPAQVVARAAPPVVPMVTRTAPAVRGPSAYPPRPVSRPVPDGWKTW